MRRLFVAIAFILTATPPIRALAGQTRTITSTDEPSRAADTAANSPATVATIPYETLRNSYRIDPVVGLAAVRLDPAGNSGRAIEVVGTITGVMSTNESGRTVVMETNEGTALIKAPENITGNDQVRSGARVRALLLATETYGGDLTLTLLGATANLEPASLFRAPYGDDLIVVPSGADVALPAPRVSGEPRQQGRLTTGAGALRDMAPVAPPQAAVDPATIALQKPAYMNLVHRFNSKLNNAQLDEIATALLRSGAENRLDPRFLAAIIAVESDFDIYCLSSSGAMGLGQLMPFNLKEAGITNAWDPTENILATGRLLRGHLNEFGSRPNGTLLAVAAYNAGPGAVRRAGYQVPPGAQVQRYVWKVYYRYKEFAPELFVSH